MAKPTIIFIHGAFHSSSFFSRVIAILSPLGYKCIALSMPSVGRSPPVTSLDEDIATVRGAVLQELEAGNEMVMNAHSWGGVPTTSALDGLSKAERASEGKKGGVVKLTFVAAILLPKGVSVEMRFGGVDPRCTFNEDGTVWFGVDFIPEFYNDLDHEDAIYWTAKLRPHSLATIKDEARSAAYQKISCAYMVCENDNTLPVQIQDAMIEDARKDGAEIEVERLFVSHSPHLVKPGAVAGFLRRAAGEELEIPS